MQELDKISWKSWVRNTMVGVMWDDLLGQVASGGICACVGGAEGSGLPFLADLVVMRAKDAEDMFKPVSCLDQDDCLEALALFALGVHPGEWSKELVVVDVGTCKEGYGEGIDNVAGAGNSPGPRAYGQDLRVLRRLGMLASLIPGGAVWLKSWMKL